MKRKTIPVTAVLMALTALMSAALLAPLPPQAHAVADQVTADLAIQPQSAESPLSVMIAGNLVTYQAPWGNTLDPKAKPILSWQFDNSPVVP